MPFGSRWVGFGVRSLPFWVSVSFLGFWVGALLLTKQMQMQNEKKLIRLDGANGGAILFLCGGNLLTDYRTLQLDLT